MSQRGDKKSLIVLKILANGIIYAIATCIVQVPFANILYSILKMEPGSILEENRLPWLLLTIFIVGVALALFYYVYGYLFYNKNRWIKGTKFTLFIYLSNYLPQVFFLDATNGAWELIAGGFPIIQVELFDFLILLITVLIMVQFIHCRHEGNAAEKGRHLLQSVSCGFVFAMVLVALNEILLPIIGFTNMADGLGVSETNRSFFYSVLTVGFWFAGALVSHVASKEKVNPGSFILIYSILVWCVFDLTMLPLGFGVVATVLFIFESVISFSAMHFIFMLLSRTNRSGAINMISK